MHPSPQLHPSPSLHPQPQLHPWLLTATPTPKHTPSPSRHPQPQTAPPSPKRTPDPTPPQPLTAPQPPFPPPPPTQGCPSAPHPPVTSAALRLTALSTVPSLLRSNGLLRRSATFCFSRERTFRLGSEAAGRRKGGSYDPPPADPTKWDPPQIPCRFGTHRFYAAGNRRGRRRGRAAALCRTGGSRGCRSGGGSSAPRRCGEPWGGRDGGEGGGEEEGGRSAGMAACPRPHGTAAPHCASSPPPQPILPRRCC